ncbi:hypothetical protein F0231_04810 [Vibrio sp. RE86]|uniref:hypothetical protein n=1 Tax=Vibrio sp. RE86 TaxID=2607605 RepID=UPI001493AEEE|nr:hypothetical protein [Vibrio sp. RE86]NOH79061.1 hypothetical protein [Vibrio sp. RE86]
MKKLSIACLAGLISHSAMANITVSIEKDFLEFGIYAPLFDEAYLFVGADTDDWLGVGVGYYYDINPQWKLGAYYEYGLYDDWLMHEVGIDGVKTSSHQVDLSATHYFTKSAAKIGITAEHVRNGFTWITVDDVDKYSIYLSASHYLQHVYFTGKYEHYLAIDQSDMEDFNQGHANIWELSIGSMHPLFNFYPYTKVSVFDPNGTYYGQRNSDVTFSINGTFSFR